MECQPHTFRKQKMQNDATKRRKTLTAKLRPSLPPHRCPAGSAQQKALTARHCAQERAEDSFPMSPGRKPCNDQSYRQGNRAKCKSTLTYALRGSNPRPMAHRTIALTTELRERAECSTTPAAAHTKNTCRATPKPEHETTIGYHQLRSARHATTACLA